MGNNLRVAYGVFKGFNYNDAFVISKRLIKEDILTYHYVKKHTISIRETPQGKELITKHIPNIENLTISDFLWDRLQYKDSITEFTNINNSSSNMDLVLHSSLENSAISLFNVKFYFVVLLLMFIYKLYCLNKMIFIKIFKFYLDNSSIYTGIVLLSKNIIYIFNYLLNTFIRELVLLYM